MATATLNEPAAVTDATFDSAIPTSGSLRIALRLFATAAPSTGVPSEKFTFGRNSIVHDLKSALGVNAFARYGCAIPFSS